MRAWRIEGEWSFDHLRIADLPEPEPRRGEAVVAMRAAALNARDLVVPLRGYGRGTGELPLIPLSDGAGEVVAVGEGVTRVKPGDRVCPTFFQNWAGGPPGLAAFASALGGPHDGVAAERTRFSAEGLVRIPDALTFEEAATLPCAGLTAWSAIVTLGAVKPGDRVLVQGTGGVALFALAFAKLAGAHVTIISSSDERLERARALGADEGINYARNPDWAAAAKGIAAERGGFDLIVELGGAETLPLSLRAVRPGGMIALIGVLSGLALSASLGPVVTRQIRLQGVTVGARDGFEAMLAAVALHGLRPVIGEVFAFDRLHDAFARQRAGGAFGKTLIRFER